MQRIYLILLLCGLSLATAAQGFTVTVNVPGYSGQQAFLGYYLGESQYVMDTVEYADEKFVFEGDEPLESGFYLLVFPPENNYCQLLIDARDTDIRITLDPDMVTKPIAVEGAPDTRLFYQYAEFIGERRKSAGALQTELESTQDEKRLTQIEQELEAINDEVEDKQEEFLVEHAGTLTAMLIKSSMEPEIPEFEGADEEVDEKVFNYYKAHYFDNIEMRDPRLARTPFMGEKIKYYVDKLTVQQPDSICKSIDHILGQFDKDSEAFQVFLVSFLNKYAKSKIVGMDAVYVHLVNEYYAQGLAPWTDEEQLAKIVKNASTLEPILIGKAAPDLKLQDRDKAPVTVHGIEADYTVLFFWDPECGHCKKSVPKIIEFYEEYNPKGVEILAICTKLQEGEKACWEAVDDRGMDIWKNASDPYLRSRFKQIYDVRTTPQIFILDKDKKIIMKRIGAEQLPDVLDHFIREESGS